MWISVIVCSQTMITRLARGERVKEAEGSLLLYSYKYIAEDRKSF